MTEHQELKIELQNGSKTIELTIAASIKEIISSELEPRTLPEKIVLSGRNIKYVYDAEIDCETPIQIYDGNEGNLSKILLLEETDYEIRVETDLPDEYIFPYLFKNGKSISVNSSYLKNDTPGSKYYDLRFRSYVGKGLFDFVIEKKEVSIPFEVRSKKIDYRIHYVSMLKEISEFAAALLLKSTAPLHQDYESSYNTSSIKYEDFLVLEYIMADDRFPSAYEYLRKNLHSNTFAIEERTPISLVKSFNPTSIIESIRPDNIIECDEGMIDGRYSFLELEGYNNNETIDTPENRFVKDFLLSLYDFSTILLNNLSKQSDYVKDRLKAIIMQLEEYMMDGWISEVGELQYIPYYSTILQKRNGYAEIFEFYLILGTGLKLSLGGAEDLFEGHNKKLYRVYEYWCYLKLFDSLKSLSKEKPEFSLSDTKNDWETTIKTNDSKLFRIPVEDTFLQVELYFNKEYSTNETLFKSYSLMMKPDYSLIISPENSLDRSKFIVHFDAKYKAEKSDNSTEDEEEDIEDSELSEKGYRKEDIRKMHTYRDALLKSWGSYILYPGSEYDVFKRYDFPDIKMKTTSLPSVGAVPLVPGGENSKLIEHLDSIFHGIYELSKHVYDGEFFADDFFERKK